MTVQTQETLLKKLNAIDQMPTLPVVLTPLLHYMEQPLERLEVQQVVDLISQDKSLTAQCLQLANSPLFGQWQKIDSVRAAVMALGMQRMRDVAMSCSVLTLLPPETAGADPHHRIRPCPLRNRNRTERTGSSGENRISSPRRCDTGYRNARHERPGNSEAHHARVSLLGNHGELA